MTTRRRTEVGTGAFGRPRPHDAHAREVLSRILTRGLPLTEDAVFLCLWHQLTTRRHSQVLQKVKASKDVGGHRYFSFSPDIDLLEITPQEKVIGYELKGYQKRARSVAPPQYYAGIDEALAYLVNPTFSPSSDTFGGSIFDEVWVVHPEGSGISDLADLVSRLTPLGLMTLNHRGESLGARQAQLVPRPRTKGSIPCQPGLIRGVSALQGKAHTMIR